MVSGVCLGVTHPSLGCAVWAHISLMCLIKEKQFSLSLCMCVRQGVVDCSHMLW